MITGVGLAMQPSLMKWNNPIRPIRSSGNFNFFIQNFYFYHKIYFRSFRTVYGNTSKQRVIRHKW